MVEGFRIVPPAQAGGPSPEYRASRERVFVFAPMPLPERNKQPVSGGRESGDGPLPAQGRRLRAYMVEAAVFAERALTGQLVTFLVGYWCQPRWWPVASLGIYANYRARAKALSFALGWRRD